MIEGTERPVSRGMRITVLLLAGLETVLFAIVAFFALHQALSSNEQLGRSLGLAIASMAAALFVLFTLPALILGIRGRWLKTALVLVILAVAVPVLLGRFS